MFSRLLLIFVLLPLADLVLIWMLLRIHVGITIIWIVLSGVVGAWYMRRQGVRVLSEMRSSIDENKMPTDVLVEAAIVIFAGGLLITPGLLTDLIGFSMLIRPCRRWYRKRFLGWLKKKVKVKAEAFAARSPFAPQHNPFADPDIVEGEVVGTSLSDEPVPTDTPKVLPPETRAP